MSHAKPFETIIYVGVPNDPRSKLQMRAKKGIMIKREPTTTGQKSEESYFDRAEETHGGSEDVNINYSVLNWIKKPIPRKDENGTDMCYSFSVQKARFRSKEEIEEFCENYDLDYKKRIF
ncbi:hypothetical protein TNIN_486331 [Trichonephila inaurata madagascariensis]|uniref:Uncharacterized protein n=1 Tax=Trichonephila inaurata madagascariensis TaxID=2747483 RepID=A0A8X6WPF5_9ARAC|nr:hypothetical protein TNIN_486331 [Trichonephila inaurata madagascariensis]